MAYSRYHPDTVLDLEWPIASDVSTRPVFVLDYRFSKVCSGTSMFGTMFGEVRKNTQILRTFPVFLEVPGRQLAFAEDNRAALLYFVAYTPMVISKISDSVIQSSAPFVPMFGPKYTVQCSFSVDPGTDQ